MTQEDDQEERTWATRVARAFLADQGAGGRGPATEEGAARTRGVLVVAVVPLPVRAPADDEHEDAPS